MVTVLNSIQHLYSRLIIARFVVKNGHQIDMCYDENGPCAAVLRIQTHHSRFCNETIRRAYMITWRERVFTMTSCNSCFSWNSDSETWHEGIRDSLQLLSVWNHFRFDGTVKIVCEVGNAHDGATYLTTWTTGTLKVCVMQAISLQHEMLSF